jgi:flagella basal body P-ring formation protein FlgA
MNAGLAAAESSPVLNRSGASNNATQRDIVVKPGDTVRVFFASDRVRMDLEGRVVKSAAIGDRVEVVLQRNADESEHRIHGTLRAQSMVEVQP